jgi:ABC-2 type transport system ATP-binding protein
VSILRKEEIMSGTAVSIQNVYKQYVRQSLFSRSKSTVLEDLCFDVPYGQSVAVLGPNGAGKTTLLKAILGLISFRGQIRLCDSPPGHVDARRKTGFVPEHPVTYPFLKKDEFLHFFKSIEKNMLLKSIENCPSLASYNPDFEGIMDFVRNISPDRKMSEYSKGMTQRLNFVRALGKNPEILFLDEPVIGLDPIGQLNIIAMIKKFHSTGRTVYINTHSIDFAFEVADRIIILHRGRMHADIGVRDWSKKQVSDLFMGLDSEMS